MSREVLTINVGQAGVQLGDAIWNQYCAEHDIDTNGNCKNNNPADKSFTCLFEETNDKKYVPRNLMIDTEPNVIDDIKQSKYKSIYNPDNLINGKEDAANNFARGFYSIGADMKDIINDKLRKLYDTCDNLQGFIINHSVGGGTGSGLASLILETLAVDYRKKTKFGFEIYPSPIISTSVVAPYNALFATHYLLDHTEVSVILDNEAMYEICQKQLDIKRPSYNNLNRLTSKTISSITTGLRFNSANDMNCNLIEFQTNLVPFPRLHFMMTSMAPITSNKKIKTINNSSKSLTSSCFDPQNFFVKLSDFDADEDKYMAAFLNYRGDVTSKDASNTTNWLKTNRKVSFVEWCPTGFKISFNQKPVSVVKNYDDIAPFNKNITMIANNVAMSRIFSERISKKFDLMYSQRAFVHWFVSEGMEEGEFAEAREDIGFLEKDYLDILSEQCTDDCSDDDDDSDDCIGFAVGGAKDVTNFRKLIEMNKVPTKSSITYNGLLYEYFFDTKKRKSDPNKQKNIKNNALQNDDPDEKKQSNDDGSKLFYPSYCYAKIKKKDYRINPNKSDNNSNFEYYMTVGLNSNIKKNEFKRKKLNITIILDRSGSMNVTFPNEYGINAPTKRRMQVANEACVELLKHLKDDDRFCFIVFDHNIDTVHALDYVSNINMDELTKEMLAITAGGENEFCDAYKTAIKYYDKLFKKPNYDGNEYENRIIFITDAQIHIGCSDPNLLKYVSNDADKRKKNRIYTTFIGIGLDFYSTLCEQISSTRGCNYYSVKNTQEFKLKMQLEFEYMVTPLVFNVSLKLKCEGSVCEIEKVYGAKDKKADKIMNSGEITKIGTLFPSLKSKKKGGTKGGIQLIKLKSKSANNDNMNVELIVSFEDVNGKKYKNNQFVTFNPPSLTVSNDMIDSDDSDDDNFDNDDNENFYDNLGIRKGILLCKYVELLHEWIDSNDKDQYKKEIFPKFLNYFKKEMKKCNDQELQKEVDVLNKIINPDFGSNNNYNDSDSDDD